MITPSERAYIAEHAYVPEHLPHYVTAISQTEPFVINDFVVHVAGTSMVFVGYPLCGTFSAARMLESIDEAKKRFRPAVVSVIAPALPGPLKECALSPPDDYYRLDLSCFVIPRKTGSMLKRARRDVSVSIGTFGREHKRLVDDLMLTHRLDKAMQFIFKRLPEYVKCDTAIVFDARTLRGDLVAFTVAEYGAKLYAFYMFNCRSREHNVPGASDLMFTHVIECAQAEGKQYVNMGLGVDAGIAFFKTKWGATPFLRHFSSLLESQTPSTWGKLFDRFL
jgi:hypothetical protein